jgi:ribosomal protein S18 acetylase RimI-like enzyme
MGLNAVDDSRDGIGKYLMRNPTTSFVALAKGKIVGVIMAGHDGRRGYIHHTAVLPEYRGQGIAQNLVEHAMDALDKEGIIKANLVAFRDNDLGNGFWEHIGFHERTDLVYRDKALRPFELVKTE